MHTPIRCRRWRFWMGTGAVTALSATLALAAPIQPPQSDKPTPESESVSLPAELPVDAVDLTDKVEVTVNGKLRSTSSTSHTITFSVKNTSDEDLQGPIVVLVAETGIEKLELDRADGNLSDERPYVEIVGEKGQLKAGRTLRGKKLVFKTEDTLTLAQRNAFEAKLIVCRIDEEAALAASDADEDRIEGKSYGWKEFDKIAAIQEKWTLRLIEDGKGQVYGTGIAENDKGELVVNVYTERPNTDDIVPDTIDGMPVQIFPIGQMFQAGPARDNLIYRNGRAKKGQRGNEDDFVPVPDEGPDEPSGTSSPLPPSADPTVRFTRPVPIGVSIANADVLFVDPMFLNCYSGTLGCRCVDSLGTEYILTNLHVGGALNLPFDTPLVMTGNVGDRIVQPSTGDMLSFCTIDPANVIGILADVEPVIVPQDGFEQSFFINIMDTAVATANPGMVGSAPPVDGYPMLRRDVVHRPYLGMEVQKYGRTSSYTRGIINGLNIFSLIGYGQPGQLPSFFVRQMSVTNPAAVFPVPPGGFTPPGFPPLLQTNPSSFGLPGDSGSLIVQYKPGTPEDGRPVALLFAGGPRGAIDLTLANPIGPIMARYGLEVDDGSGAPSSAGISGSMGGAIGPLKPPSYFQ